MITNFNTQNLKIGTLNCQGLKEKKIDYPEIHNLISSCDLFDVTETWFGKNDDACVEGYKFYPINRKISKGPTKGGVGLFIKKEL